jgi:hypothetical protein
VSTWTTNEMQLIACIYVRQDVLLKSKMLLHDLSNASQQDKKSEGGNCCP